MIAALDYGPDGGSWPQQNNSLLFSSARTTPVPRLRFDRLLDRLARIIPRFNFQLPPYFINNARGLSTLEGIAVSLDPSFNVLTKLYPHALNHLMVNPNDSKIVEETVQALVLGENGLLSPVQIWKVLGDAAVMGGGRSRKRVAWDV
eukprot:CAMPEP_0113300260 /NCGR_PEP_ID=MMETSP0010_2-20120614/1966_1 /TAXON_ID=216773 ORGANISM="Corethron hystrix, Strain 308" /NCGR_SAMPLE_ID=MMETSP0010_2 /ASSEMBLY_ACC=CAM_ASM_000155 /LENGTH=146 /DNA_ID=CAMNT_0000153659 /DNA_START=29 /DNA_END=466 /DNA_ORIENTATION=- /assembly_acc=CAM_ASM_000155